MAQKFLAELLKVENTVPKDEDDAKRCCICLEDYGTLDSTTGSVELPIRLPCRHIGGSVCFTKWFGENNSCPVCRHTYFPAQPRPYLEHGIFDNEELRASIQRVGNAVITADFEQEEALHNLIRGAQRLGTLDEARITEAALRERLRFEPRGGRMVVAMCAILGLGLNVQAMAEAIAEAFAERTRNEFHSPACCSALSIFIAIHLLGLEDEYPRFLTQLPTLDMDPDHVLGTWRIVYPHRRGLITPSVLASLERNTQLGIFSFLPIPESALDGIANTDENRQPSSRRLSLEPLERSDTGAIRSWLSELVGEDDDDDDNCEAIIFILDTMLDWMSDLRDEGADYTRELSTYSDVQIAAVSMYIACHLMGVAVTYLEIALAHQVSERSVRQLYTHVYNWRDHFIQPGLIEDMGPGSVDRVLRASPPLTWPPQN